MPHHLDIAHAQYLTRAQQEEPVKPLAESDLGRRGRPADHVIEPGKSGAAPAS